MLPPSNNDIRAKVSSDQACLQNLLREVAAIVGALPQQSVDLVGAKVEIFVEKPRDTSTDPTMCQTISNWASHDHMIVDSVRVSDTTD